MKTTPLHFARLALATFVTCLATSLYAAEPAATIYNPSKGLSAGWSSDVWGGLTNDSASKVVSKEAKGVSLLITPTASSSEYAGMQISALGAAGVKLTDSLRKSGEVHLYVRNGSDLAGGPAAEQQVQVMLSFEPEGGKAINGPYQPVTLTPALAADKGTEGWQLVKLSIAEQLKGRVDAAAPVKLRAVYIQYIGQPTGSYSVGQCVVIAPAAK